MMMMMMMIVMTTKVTYMHIILFIDDFCRVMSDKALSITALKM